jgi:hypothetical protein
MKRAIFIVSIALLTSGCNYAANKVLGDRATPIDPAKAQYLDAPGVYLLREDGSFGRYCREDLAKNQALKGIVVTRETSDATVVDEVTGENLTFNFPGIPAIQVPYRKTKIEGYTLTRAESPNDLSLAEFIKRGVSANCRNLLATGKYIIVEREARAKKSSKITRLPVQTLNIPGIGGSLVITETTSPGPSGVTFGILPASP